MKSRLGIAQVALILYIAIAAAVGWIGVEGAAIFHPATHKKAVAAADAQAQQLAKDAADAQAKLAADIAANRAALAAQQAQLEAVKLVAQDAAGFVSGAVTAIAGEQSPSVGVRVASILIGDAAGTLPAATSAQVKAYQVIVEQMKADNARLSSALVQKEAEAADAKKHAEVSQKAAEVAVAKAAVSDSEAKLASAAVVSESKAHAIALVKLDAKVGEEVTFSQRLKAFGIGGGVFLFVLVPLLALAFPPLVPVLRGLSAPLLKLWHVVHERERAFITDLHAKATAEAAHLKSKLEAELESHAATKALLKL